MTDLRDGPDYGTRGLVVQTQPRVLDNHQHGMTRIRRVYGSDTFNANREDLMTRHVAYDFRIHATVGADFSAHGRLRGPRNRVYVTRLSLIPYIDSATAEEDGVIAVWTAFCPYPKIA